MGVLLLGLVIYLAAEIAAFVVVAEQIGVLLAVILVVALSAIGPLLVRRAGLGVLTHARHRLEQGESPNRDLLDGVVILLAGALICVPGFIGDVIGLALLIPPVRHLLIRLSGRAIARRLSHRAVMRVGQRCTTQDQVIDAPSRAESEKSESPARRHGPHVDRPDNHGSPPSPS